MIEFRLNSEGSNKNPLWGIAFRHKNDLPKALDIDKPPPQIDIEFPDRKIITFGIRPSFWSRCHEFVDAQAIDRLTGLKIKPIRAFAVDKLGYNVETKRKCTISVEVIEKNRFLKIITFI
jgi:DNA polymerase elongation subunit (family B)